MYVYVYAYVCMYACIHIVHKQILYMFPDMFLHSTCVIAYLTLVYFQAKTFLESVELYRSICH